MAGKRILFLGVTGVDKRQALSRLAGWHKENQDQDCDQIDFEHDCLFDTRLGGNLHETFLDSGFTLQVDRWQAAWSRFMPDHKPNGKSVNHTFLAVHGCYIRGHYGARVVLNPVSVAAFQPDLIVTLIADVYDLWWNTEIRAGGQAWRGRPTLEQLILGRRQETVVGDQIAAACQTGGHAVRHLMLSVGHPCDTLGNVINARHPHVVYLSFPISEPRRMSERGDLSGTEAVSSFIKKAYKYQTSVRTLAFICPLGIDELPLVFALPDQYTTADLVLRPTEEEDQKNKIEFNRDDKRWNMNAFWPENVRLALPSRSLGYVCKNQLCVAAGNIWTDVTWRDYRLVGQSDCVAAFNPVFNKRDRMAGGVRQEIAFATANGKPVYIFQDPVHDPKDVVGKYLRDLEESTMGTAPTGNLITRVNSEDELLKVVAK